MSRSIPGESLAPISRDADYESATDEANLMLGVQLAAVKSMLAAVVRQLGEDLATVEQQLQPSERPERLQRIMETLQAVHRVVRSVADVEAAIAAGAAIDAAPTPRPSASKDVRTTPPPALSLDGDHRETAGLNGGPFSGSEALASLLQRSPSPSRSAPGEPEARSSRFSRATLLALALSTVLLAGVAAFFAPKQASTTPAQVADAVTGVTPGTNVEIVLAAPLGPWSLTPRELSGASSSEAGTPAQPGPPGSEAPGEPAVVATSGLLALKPLEANMLDALIDYRFMDPVTLDPALTELARERSRQLASRGSVAATKSDDDAFLDALRLRGITTGVVGEIAGSINAPDDLSTDELFEAFYDSDEHFEHLREDRYEWVGVGVTLGPDSTKYYTIIFRGPP